MVLLTYVLQKVAISQFLNKTMKLSNKKLTQHLFMPRESACNSNIVMLTELSVFTKVLCINRVFYINGHKLAYHGAMRAVFHVCIIQFWKSDFIFIYWSEQFYNVGILALT